MFLLFVEPAVKSIFPNMLFTENLWAFMSWWLIKRSSLNSAVNKGRDRDQLPSIQLQKCFSTKSVTVFKITVCVYYYYYYYYYFYYRECFEELLSICVLGRNYYYIFSRRNHRRNRT